MKKWMMLFAVVFTVLNTQSAHASTGDIFDAYSNLSGYSFRITLISPIAPTLTTIQAFQHKIIVDAQEDAAFYMATGEMRPYLQRAIDMLRQDFGADASDEEIVLAIFAE